MSFIISQLTSKGSGDAVKSMEGAGAGAAMAPRPAHRWSAGHIGLAGMAIQDLNRWRKRKRF
jgi:hypothetical protein